MEILCGITSLGKGTAAALTLYRGPWKVENPNHYTRYVTCGEDLSLIRTG